MGRFFLTLCVHLPTDWQVSAPDLWLRSNLKKEGYQGIDVRGYAASYVYGSIEVFEVK